MSKVDYDEIFTNNGVLTFLESKDAEFWVEVTLNYPRCPKWNNLNSDKQKALYLKHLNDIKNSCGFGNLEVLSYGFEISKDGHYHFHTCLHSTCKRIHFPLGVVSDIVKSYLNALPAKNKKYLNACMYSKWLRYAGPGCCVQYRTSEEVERVETWLNYIHKYSKV